MEEKQRNFVNNFNKKIASFLFRKIYKYVK